MTRRAVAIFTAMTLGPFAACAPSAPATSPPAEVAASTPAKPRVGPRAASAATSLPEGLRLISTSAITAPAATGPAAKDWVAAVPARAVAARVDDVVWAAFPLGDEVRVEPCRVRAITARGATLEADDHSVHQNVSGALIHLAADPLTIKLGDVVTYFDWRRDLGVAVVLKRDWLQRLDIKFRDSARVVRDEPIHVAEPLPNDVAPLAWVAFPYPPAPDPRPLYRGLVFAIDGARVFVRDDANRAWVVPLGEVKLLGLSNKPRKEGDTVSAFEYGTGFRSGTIKKVFDPGFAYGVARDGDGAVRSFYFSDMVDAL